MKLQKSATASVSTTLKNPSGKTPSIMMCSRILQRAPCRGGYSPRQALISSSCSRPSCTLWQAITLHLPLVCTQNAVRIGHQHTFQGASCASQGCSAIPGSGHQSSLAEVCRRTPSLYGGSAELSLQYFSLLWLA